MKKNILVLILLLLGYVGFTQNLKNALSMGGKEEDFVYSMAIDKFENIYTIGAFSGTSDFDPSSKNYNLTSKGNFDIFISKIDKYGKFVWAKSIGAQNIDYGHAIAVDSIGNIYCTGAFSNTVDFDPNAGVFNLVSTSISVEMFILKLNGEGKLLWAKQISGGVQDLGISIYVDKKSQITITGSCHSTVDFDPGPNKYEVSSFDGTDIFILKLDSSGNFLNAGNMGSIDFENGNSITVDDSGYIYSTGFFKSLADFDPGKQNYLMTASGISDIFISKLNSNGKFVWAKRIGGLFDDVGNAITTDKMGNIYVTGRFDGLADFDPGEDTTFLFSEGNNDIFIIKLDRLGNLLWAKSIGGTGFDCGLALAVDDFQNIYTTGKFSQRVDFNPGKETFYLTSAGDDDIFISKLDKFGNFCWAKQMGGTVFDVGISISLTTLGTIYLAGRFQGKSDFDPTEKYSFLYSIGQNDIFITAISNCLPQIVGQPVDKNENVNSTVTFKVISTTLDAVYQWQLNSGFGFENLVNNSTYSGVTDHTLTINNISSDQDNFSFRCILTNFDCYDTSTNAVLKVNKPGFITYPNKKKYCVYPNPASDELIITSEFVLNNSEYDILDPIGNIILSGRYSNRNEAIDINSLSPGFYFLKVKDLNVVFKFIKK